MIKIFLEIHGYKERYYYKMGCMQNKFRKISNFNNNDVK